MSSEYVSNDSMKRVKPSTKMLAYMNDLKQTLGRHTDLSPMEMLAVTSQFVGSLVALQDSRTFTPEMVMDIVASNIEIGNQVVVNQLSEPKGSA